MLHATSIVGPSHTRKGYTYAKDGMYIVVETDAPSQQNSLIPTLVSQLEQQPLTLKTISHILSSLDIDQTTSITIAAHVEHVLYVATKNAGATYLYRNTNCVSILSGDGSVSGPIEDEDVFIICSPALATLLSSTDIQALISDATPQEPIDRKLTNLIHTENHIDGACCIVISPNQPETIEEPIQKEEKKGPTFSERISHISTLAPTKRKRSTLAVGMILLALLSTSIFYGHTHRQKMKTQEAYQQVQGVATSKLSEAELLVGSQDAAAHALLVDAKHQIEDALPYFPEESPEYQDLSTLLTKTQQVIKQTKKIFELDTEPDLFFNVSWAKENATGKRLAVSETTLAILDTNNNNIYTLPLDKKDPDIAVSGDKLEDAEFLALADPRIYTMTSGSTQRILNSKPSTIIPYDETWGTILDMKTYATNIYLLDGHGEIWKYPSAGSGFGAIQSWLGPGLTLDFDDAKSMSIDGNIWILDKDNVQKLSNTVPEPFYLKNEVLVSPTRMFTDKTVDYLYILETHRVIVFDKAGNYHSQYVWDGFANATDIVAIPDPHMILVLAEDKVYSIEVAQ